MDSLLLLLSLCHFPTHQMELELFVHLYETYESFSKFQLEVGPPDGIHRDYIPGKMFSMKVQGDPGATVSLVAVDNAVYLLNKDRLTQSKVCVEVKKQSEQRRIPLCVIYQQFRQNRCPNIQRGRASRKKSFLGVSQFKIRLAATVFWL